MSIPASIPAQNAVILEAAGSQGAGAAPDIGFNVKDFMLLQDPDKKFDSDVQELQKYGLLQHFGVSKESNFFEKGDKEGAGLKTKHMDAAFSHALMSLACGNDMPAFDQLVEKMESNLQELESDERIRSSKGTKEKMGTEFIGLDLSSFKLTEEDKETLRSNYEEGKGNLDASTLKKHGKECKQIIGKLDNKFRARLTQGQSAGGLGAYVAAGLVQTAVNGIRKCMNRNRLRRAQEDVTALGADTSKMASTAVSVAHVNNKTASGPSLRSKL